MLRKRLVQGTMVRAASLSLGIVFAGTQGGIAQTGASLRDAERRAVRLDRLERLAPLVLACVVVLPGCEGTADRTGVMKVAGDPEAGKAQIEAIGCGTCHQIPGVPGADGLVGPPLNHMRHRVFIAGMLRNTPSNMVMWLTAPQSVVPGNAMPDMGLTDDQAQDIAAYLYTLE